MANGELQAMPTSPEPVGLGELKRARAGRRLGLAALSGVLLLAAANLLGLRIDTAAASGGGYELRVTYGAVSRPGLATPWSVVVRHQGGFDGPITIATTRRYLLLFDENAIHPEPSKTTGTPDRLIWEFDPPPGDVLQISRDGRLEPTEHLSQTGTTAVLVGGVPVVAVSYTTRVVP